MVVGRMLQFMDYNPMDGIRIVTDLSVEKMYKNIWA